MPTYEHSGVFSYKDENKNVHLLYPITIATIKNKAKS